MWSRRSSTAKLNWNMWACNMERSEWKELSKRLEAILFSYAEALSYRKCTKILGVDFEDLKGAIELLKERYRGESALELLELNLSLQIVVKPEYAESVDLLFETDKSKGLSKPQLEVLSIVAYRQEATKRDIERIRGVNSAKIVQSLIDLDLIEPIGKKDAPGLPVIYGTTETFLVKFGLKNISELPELEESDTMSLFS